MDPAVRSELDTLKGATNTNYWGVMLLAVAVIFFIVLVFMKWTVTATIGGKIISEAGTAQLYPLQGTVHVDYSDAAYLSEFGPPGQMDKTDSMLTGRAESMLTGRAENLQKARDSMLTGRAENLQKARDSMLTGRAENLQKARDSMLTGRADGETPFTESFVDAEDISEGPLRHALYTGDQV